MAYLLVEPGNSGLPTTIEWTLPQGFKAGPIVWPTPKRIAYGPVVDYGYENEVLLPVAIEVPAELAPATDVVLSAHSSWLVCADTCIPEDAELTISVPVSLQAEPDPDWSEPLASSRAHLPLPNPFPTTVTLTASAIALHVDTGDAGRLRDAVFFPADRDVIDDDAPQATTAGPKGLTLTLPRDGTKPPPTLLKGLLVFRDSAAQGEAESEAIMISTPVTAGPSSAAGGLGFSWAVALAFAGGVLLNLMPCVLPVLSIKVFGWWSMPGRRRARCASRARRTGRASWSALRSSAPR